MTTGPVRTEDLTRPQARAPADATPEVTTPASVTPAWRNAVYANVVHRAGEDPQAAVAFLMADLVSETRALRHTLEAMVATLAKAVDQSKKRK